MSRVKLMLQRLMLGMDPVAETQALLLLVVRALVTDTDAVVIGTSFPIGGLTLFHVIVSARDKGKVIGKQGRIARSLRTYLTAVGRKHGLSFALDVGGLQGNVGGHEGGSLVSIAQQGSPGARSGGLPIDSLG